MNIDFRECPRCHGYGVLDDGENCAECVGGGRRTNLTERIYSWERDGMGKRGEHTARPKDWHLWSCLTLWPQGLPGSNPGVPSEFLGKEAKM